MPSDTAPVVTVAAPGDGAEWDRYLASISRMAPGAAFGWGAILAECYGAEAVPFMARDGQEVCGVMLTYVPRSAGSGAVLYSAPLVANNEEAARALLDAAGNFAGRRGISRSVIGSGDLYVNAPFHHWTKATIKRPVPATEDEAWASLRKKTRYSIRRAQDAAIEVKQGLEHLPDFYSIYRARMAELLIPPHGLSYFERMAALLKGNLSLYVATKNARVIGGMIFVFGGGTAFYRFNAADGDAQELGANYALMWSALRDFVLRGIAEVDLDESSPGGGVYNFKTVQFGGAPSDVHYYDVTRTQDGAAAAPASVPLSHKLMHRAMPFLPNQVQSKWLQSQKKFGRLL